MQHYYFNLTDGRRLYPDPMGLMLDNLAAVRRHAIGDARSLLESWMARSTLPWRLEVHDSSGALAYSISLAEAAVSEALPVFHGEDDQADRSDVSLEAGLVF